MVQQFKEGIYEYEQYLLNWKPFGNQMNGRNFKKI